MEKGNHEALLSLTSEQLDVVGNTEMLSWMIMFGMIGDQPGELITYQPTWHHGHAVMRFLPDKRTGKLSEEGTKGPATYKFKGSEGYEFYKHPSPSAYKLNKILYDLRFKPSLRVRLINDIPSVAAEYGLPAGGIESPGDFAGRGHREIPQRHGSSLGEGGGASPRNVDERDRVPCGIAQAARRGRQGEPEKTSVTP